ncbi:MAG TPA: 2Fe-2S iron-sulfur cluster binding domain-containing protein [Chloroflexi bacterium]|nr:2Fe-2S iron-sulfur cluster binding domain-containing protein [Chloroflexota bacterium]
MNEVTLIIDGRPVTAAENATILQAARQVGIDIPTICYHDACTANAICRLCVVEVEKQRLLQPACVTQVREGMVIHTRSERVERSRRTILEMLDSAVDLSDAPEIQAQLAEYGADHNRFPAAERRAPALIDDNPMYVRDYAKCVLCWRCVQVCAEDAQYTFALSFDGRGFGTQIGTYFDLPMPETTCVFCGQCVGVCPTGALKPRREWLLEQGKTPDEIMELTRAERRKSRRAKQ